MRYYTDYQISWDYELDDYIDKKYIITINKILKEIKKEIKNPIVKNIVVTPILLKENQLGVYCYGTKQYIGIDVGNVVQACDEYKINYYRGIKTTILHEIFHAMQDSKGKELNEIDAEDFALDFVDYGTANTI